MVRVHCAPPVAEAGLTVSPTQTTLLETLKKLFLAPHLVLFIFELRKTCSVTHRCGTWLGLLRFGLLSSRVVEAALSWVTPRETLLLPEPGGCSGSVVSEITECSLQEAPASFGISASVRA